jgi:hypothetical protein
MDGSRVGELPAQAHPYTREMTAKYTKSKTPHKARRCENDWEGFVFWAGEGGFVFFRTQITVTIMCTIEFEQRGI